MNENKAKQIALFRYQIIAPLVSSSYTGESMSSFFREAAEIAYSFEGNPVSIAPGTIKDWYMKYRKLGLEGITPKTRNDVGNSRSISNEANARIRELIEELPKITGTAIRLKLIQEGIIKSTDTSLSTVERFITKNRLRNPKSKKDRKAFQMEHVNDCWQADSSPGPFMRINGKLIRLHMVLFIDDASRRILACDLYTNDNALNMQKTFKSCILKYGKPKRLYVDNGGPYSNQQLELICASLGLVLINAKPRDAQAKGKVERTFRSIKDGWLNTFDWNAYQTIEEFQVSLQQFIDFFNNRIHSTLKESPNSRFLKDKERLQYLPFEMVDRCFLHTVDRKVRNDACVSMEGRFYEVPHLYIGEHVTLKYRPDDTTRVYLVGDQGWIECREVNREDNAKMRRSSIDYAKVGE